MESEITVAGKREAESIDGDLAYRREGPVEDPDLVKTGAKLTDVETCLPAMGIRPAIIRSKPTVATM